MAEKMPLALLQGDKVEGITDYLDALPVNVSGVVKEVMGVAGYMFQQPGLTQYGLLAQISQEHDYVTLDGSTYLELLSDLTGIVDGKLGTLVARIRRSANSDDGLLSNTVSPTNHGIFVDINASGFIRLQSKDIAGTTILDAISDVAFTTPGTWLNICLSWDAATAPQLYVNDTLVAMTLNTWTDQALDYTGTQWNVYDGSSRPFGGDTNFLIFDSVANTDFSIEANRRLFFDSDGCPMDNVGDIGTTKIAYFAGNSGTFATNKGTGGGFTLTGGVLTDGSEECP